MPKQKPIYILMLILLAVSLIFFGIISFSSAGRLKVVFLDVGQGDSILISQGSNQILVDGGPSSKTQLEKLGKHIPFWDRKIEMVMATHPDQDHIEGLVGVIRNYEVGVLIDSPAESDSQVYKNYLEVAEKKKIKHIQGEKGMKIRFGGADLEIMYPISGSESGLKDTNAGSLVAKLSYGRNSFLLTGDFPTKNDTEIFASGADLSARVLKAAHHGSKYSTSEEFLEKVDPEDAIVSVGAKNRYGHPSAEVLERLKKKKINIFRTDEWGDIAYSCFDPEKICEMEVN